MLRGEYRGSLINDSLVEGKWTQAGMSYDLDIVKQEKAFQLNRPQEPKPPFPYKEENVSMPSVTDEFMLGGTLTIPEGEGPFPGLILISGSGSQNRDEEIFGHKPFKVLADHLSRNGIAVLRYDDRGVGESGGNPLGATSADLAMDARSAFEYLLNRTEIDNSKIGIIGHSEGGLIAFKLASEYDDIAFIISMAGPGVKGRVILEEQTEYISRLNNMPEDEIQESMAINKMIYDIMEKEENPEKGISEINLLVNDFYTERDVPRQYIDEIIKNIANTINVSSYPWLSYFVKSDPAGYFSGIDCPVLAINGDKDCQVMADKNITAIIKGLEDAGNTMVTGKVFKGLNHLFQHAETGLPNEYGQIEETMSTEVLEIMSDWIKGLMN